MRVYIRRVQLVLSSFLLLITTMFVVPAHASPLITEYPIPTANADVLGLANGPDGALWFTEKSSNKIGRLSPTGSITEYPIPSASSFPQSIVAGPDGALWFTEPGTGKIGRITTSGDITEYTVTTQFQPWDITNGPDGALWFTEGPSNELGRITTSGEVTKYPISNGGAFYSMVAGPDGALWLTDTSNNYITRVTTSGDVTYFALPVVNGPVHPIDITVGPDGALWFTEVYNSALGRITTSGDLTIFKIPDCGGSSVYGVTPKSITAGTDGALWFTNLCMGTNGGFMIGRMTTSGAVTEREIPTPNTEARAIITGPDGSIWFAEDVIGNKIGHISADMTAPSVTNATFSTNPKPVTQSSVVLSATVVDDITGVSSVEYYNPVQQTWQTMTVSGTTASATVSTPDLAYPAGMYGFQIRATDNANNTSTPVTIYLDVYNPAGGYAAGHGFVEPNGATSDPGDNLPSVTGPHIEATFDFSLKYADANATVPTGKSTFTWGSNCNMPNNQCFSVTVDSLSVLVVPTGSTTGTFEGLATLRYAGQSQGSNYPVKVTVSEGSTPSDPDHYLLQVYAVGGSPNNSADKIYQASGDSAGGGIEVHR